MDEVASRWDAKMDAQALFINGPGSISFFRAAYSLPPDPALGPGCE